MDDANPDLLAPAFDHGIIFLYKKFFTTHKLYFMSGTNNETANPKLMEFFATSLQELYWSETHLSQVLSSMSKAATAAELRDAFTSHAEQTQLHAKRLEEVFSKLNMHPQAVPSVGLQGLFDEGWQVIDETEDGSAVRDVALIVAAQKVEHYEIACYGSLITLAKTIGHNDVAKILGPTLEEEKQTDSKLTSIARSGVNEDAGEEQPMESAAGSSTSKEIKAEATARPVKDADGEDKNGSGSVNMSAPTTKTENSAPAAKAKKTAKPASSSEDKSAKPGKKKSKTSA
jgi:ferritin-like metal-binding protein YciE